MKNSYFFFIIIFIFSSCATTKGFKGKSDLYGLVTDKNNNAVEGYVITVNGNKHAVTNINGMFKISDLYSEKIKIEGEKVGWETLSANEIFTDNKKVYCIQIYSLKDILNKAECAIDENDLLLANELLNKAGTKNADNKLLNVLKMILFYKKEDYSLTLHYSKKIKILETEEKKSLEKAIKIIKEKKEAQYEKNN